MGVICEVKNGRIYWHARLKRYQVFATGLTDTERNLETAWSVCEQVETAIIEGVFDERDFQVRVGGRSMKKGSSRGSDLAFFYTDLYAGLTQLASQITDIRRREEQRLKYNQAPIGTGSQKPPVSSADQFGAYMRYIQGSKRGHATDREYASRVTAQVLGRSTTVERGWVYILYAPGNNLIKIGYSKRPLERLRTHRTSDPRIRPIAMWAGTQRDEAILHRRFSDQLHPGAQEWFIRSRTLDNWVLEQKNRHGWTLDQQGVR